MLGPVIIIALISEFCMHTEWQFFLSLQKPMHLHSCWYCLPHTVPLQSAAGLWLGVCLSQPLPLYPPPASGWNEDNSHIDSWLDELCVLLHSTHINIWFDRNSVSDYHTYPGMTATEASDRRQSRVASKSMAFLQAPYWTLNSLQVNSHRDCVQHW